MCLRCVASEAREAERIEMEVGNDAILSPTAFSSGRLKRSRGRDAYAGMRVRRRPRSAGSTTYT